MTTDINILAKQIHQTAVDKGWWESPRNKGEMQVLIVSELMEGLEADREHRTYPKAKTMSHDEIYTMLCNYENSGNVDEYKRLFETEIKGTIGEEMADAAIRILDTLSFACKDDDETVEQRIDGWRGTEVSIPDNLGEGLMDIVATLSRSWTSLDEDKDEDGYKEFLAIAYTDIEDFCAKHGIDLYYFIWAKMAYNKLRSYKHGGKKY